MGSSKILTLRLDQRDCNRLEKLSKATKRSRSYLAAEAIREYLTLNEWQVEEIRKAIAEADRGEFASDTEVKRMRKKWATRAR
ncbi:MAG: ribbon-helix-helix protein, CopG family [Acidobacteria bacterium]|nr:ribbon-helix-helix protein, CopG family [Acidobacteriota bacterium]MBS1864448.1 ribbon-helix-helix protein, CopG family [Acidobacteriota bacterium]